MLTPKTLVPYVVTVNMPTDATTESSWNPFHAIVRRKVLAGFEALNRRDSSVALGVMAPDVRYTFEGANALGGTRVTRAGVAKWFTRLLKLVPPSFRILRLDVIGWPWRTRVYNLFENHGTLGVQTLELRWGRAVRIHTFVDTAALASTLDATGDAEAHAAQIEE